MMADTQALEAGIHSIFGFIQRTVQPAETGVTWETIDYANKPQHEITVFNGVGGISFFLVDYYKRYGTPAALALSQGAIDWCAHFKGQHHKRGIHMGQTGAELASMHRTIALGEPAASEFSINNARFILSEPPGPIADLLGGEASNGLYLLKLWGHTGDREFLQGAERCAAWLEAQMIQDGPGIYCYCHQDERSGVWGKIQLGVAHGLGLPRKNGHLERERHRVASVCLVELAPGGCPGAIHAFLVHDVFCIPPEPTSSRPPLFGRSLRQAFSSCPRERPNS